MIIPHTELNPGTLEALIEEFVSRDGTDYGIEEVSLADKIAQVRQQLERKQVFIVFSELHESCDIKTREEIEQQRVEDEYSYEQE